MSRRLQILVVALGTICSGAVASAEELDAGVGSSPEWGSERILGGHLFEYPTLTESAFLSSTLNFQALITYNTTRTVPVGGVDITSVQQASPLLNIQLTLHVADPVSVFVDLNGGFASGITAASLVLKGESISYGVRGGAIVRLLRDERTANQVAVLGSFRYTSGTAINLQGLVDILQGNSGIMIGDIISGAYGGILVTPFSSYNSTVSGAWAHAFARWLGLQTSLGVSINIITSDPFDVVALARLGESQVNATPTAAVALTFDASSFHVPVALQLEYKLGITWVNAGATTTTAATSTSSFNNAFDLGIFYSGRPDLQAGMVFAAFLGSPPLGAFGPGNPHDTQNAFGTALTMRYVW